MGWTWAFWATAVIGALGGCCSWLWLYLASEEDMRGTAHDRSGFNEDIVTIGGVPLLLAHALGFAALLALAGRARGTRRSAWVLAVIVLLVDSLIGMVVSLSLTGGELVAVWPRPYRP